MHFTFREVPGLPSLAWCARVIRDSDEVEVLHGSGVETTPGGFVEGAWDGDFASFDFTGATILCGTGGHAEAGRVRFSASTDRLWPLFSIAKGSSVFVSQSPAFVMTIAGESPDDLYPFYAHDFLRIARQGLHCQSGSVRLRSGIRLRVHFSTIVTVDKHLTTRCTPHRLCEAPRDFQTYKSLLADGVRRVLENAADRARSTRYSSLAAISKGYDSSATAALASLAGCTEAVSLRDSRREDPREDSGASNARFVGMTCAEYDRWTYLALQPSVDAEFAYFTYASVAPFAAAEHLLRDRVLVVGTNGDAIWNTKYCGVFDNLSRTYARYTTGLGQLEFRLRVGYQILSPAMIGARHSPSIHRIAISDEMRPWSIGGDYDRTIPRRIAEEAGLPREAFGMSKTASGHAHFTNRKGFSTPALEHYVRFVRERQTAGPWPLTLYWRLRAGWRARLLQALGKPRVVSSSWFQRRFTFILNRRPMYAPYEFMFVFQWAVAVMRGRYAVSSEALFPVAPGRFVAAG